jgi:uncharacterized DUF497 family protein
VRSPLEQLAACVGFQWDEGNTQKSWVRQRVSRPECEEVFFNQPLVAASDVEHSEIEVRYYVLGTTIRGRRLFIACTIREQLIRVISARPMSRRERRIYDQATPETDD